MKGAATPRGPPRSAVPTRCSRTPDRLHAAQAVRAARPGKHVFVEEGRDPEVGGAVGFRNLELLGSHPQQ